jgi:hypothetical protein
VELPFFYLEYLSKEFRLKNLNKIQDCISKRENLIFSFFFSFLNIFSFRMISRRQLLKTRSLIRWLLFGIWHSTVIYNFTYALLAPGTALVESGRMLDSDSHLNALVITQITIVIHIKLFLEWNYLTEFFVLSYSISLLAYCVLALLLNAFIL